MIEVLLVDDHELVRTGMRLVLDKARGITVKAEVDRGEDALAYLRGNHVDIVVMDIMMPGIGGMETIRRLNRFKPDQRVVVVSIQSSEAFPARILRMGVMGYLTKGAPAKELVQAVRAVCMGQRYISTEVAQKMAIGLLSGGGSPIDTLSQREMQVMLMVAEGQGHHQIADTLCVSPKTVGTYRYRLYEKLDVSNDVELTRLAIEYGLTDPLLASSTG